MRWIDFKSDDKSTWLDVSEIGHPETLLVLFGHNYRGQEFFSPDAIQKMYKHQGNEWTAADFNEIGVEKYLLIKTPRKKDD